MASLADGPKHGHAMIADIAQMSGTRLGPGTLYGAIARLEEQRLIEPLPPEHPLWTMPNVLLTPHMAGHGPYLNDRRYEIMKENCRRFAAGKDLMNEVDKGVWF